jgi:hypothetical protein
MPLKIDNERLARLSERTVAMVPFHWIKLPDKVL